MLSRNSHHRQGYEKFGFNVQPNGDIVYREWAPSALRAYLIGDFNGWNRESHQMKKNDFGVFEITVPASNGSPAISHDSKVKVMPESAHQPRID